MSSEYQKLVAVRDKAVKEVADTELAIVEIEAKLKAAEEGSKVTSLDLKDVDGAAQRRAEELSKIVVLRDMLDKAKEAHAAAQQAARDAYAATCEHEYRVAQEDVLSILSDLSKMALEYHELLADAARLYWARLDRQPVAHAQSPFDQALNDLFDLALKGEGYKGSTSYRDVNTAEKIVQFYDGKIGGQYGLKIHTHLETNNLWHQQPRDSAAYQGGLARYMDQKKKRGKKSAA
ncbi:hypothetical protein RUESEDTHA_00853 [Ruegeria sp. THAF57]|uniref:hypothetical protein n=1 Tax=Ruegeria sp. THAF57 TaxID=2744555 RepID=UPI0015E03D94|nr:hypothetical protein [Ruegeria sp. THAF57]CAD0183976.1 hypothetical protein RUESEDTHA_00853 [Ruegeria sp. THAF57]